MAIKKITKSVFWLSIGILSVIFADLFTYEDIFKTSQSVTSDNPHKDETYQRVNYHLDHLARKMQLQKLKTVSTLKEIEGLKMSHPRLHVDQVTDSHQPHQQKTLKNRGYLSLTDEVDAYLNQKKVKEWVEAVEAQKDEEYRNEMIKIYQEKARQAGFEITIKDNQVVNIRKSKFL